MNSNVKQAVLWIVLLCVAALIWIVVRTGRGPNEQQLTFSQFMTQVEQGKVKKVSIGGHDVKGDYQDGQRLVTKVPLNYPDLYKVLRDKNVDVDIREASSGNLVSILINAIPFVLLLAFWIFMMRQMQSGGNKALSFGKSRARLHTSQQKKVTFKDVAGVEEAKEELQEIIEFLREPQKFQKLGGRIPKGVLLIAASTELRRSRLWKALDMTDIHGDPRFATPALCRENLKALEGEVQKRLLTRPAEEWEQILQAAGVTAMTVRTIPEIVQHPQVRAREFFHTFERDPELGVSITVPKTGYHLSATPARLRSQPPRIGQHTAEILAGLGYSAADIARLRASGTI